MQTNELMLAMRHAQDDMRQLFEPHAAPDGRQVVRPRARRGESRWRRPVL